MQMYFSFNTILSYMEYLIINGYFLEGLENLYHSESMIRDFGFPIIHILITYILHIVYHTIRILHLF